MTTTSLLLLGALALATMPLASAKSYEFTFNEPEMVGSVRLKPGDYILKVKGSNAIFEKYLPSINYPFMGPVFSEFEKSFTVPVKLEEVDQKFGQTVSVSTKNGDIEQIEMIELGGTHTELHFRPPMTQTASTSVPAQHTVPTPTTVQATPPPPVEKAAPPAPAAFPAVAQNTPLPPPDNEANRSETPPTPMPPTPMPHTSAGWLMMLLSGGTLSGAGMMLRRKR